jgi:hypothetical protein
MAMKRPGRRSTAALSIPSVDGTPALLRPPPELTGPALAIFLDLTTAVPRGHFRPSDRPLLVAYARAIADEAEAAARKLAEGAVVDGK